MAYCLISPLVSGFFPLWALQKFAMNVGWKAVRHTAPFAWNQPQNEQELRDRVSLNSSPVCLNDLEADSSARQCELWNFPCIWPCSLFLSRRSVFKYAALCLSLPVWVESLLERRFSFSTRHFWAHNGSMEFDHSKAKVSLYFILHC